jgi:hypothetical protein
MNRLPSPLRKALATFVFSTTGVLIGVNNIFDADVAVWQLVASTGIGSLINLAYRWAEAEVKKGD